MRGPVTLITGKKQRITIIEVPNDLTAMIDVAKIADLVLMVVDASYGFEMVPTNLFFFFSVLISQKETFEFLNLLQSHGFPKVMGVLNHLDSFTKQSALSKTKKILKKRFWSEIYEGKNLYFNSLYGSL